MPSIDVLLQQIKERINYERFYSELLAPEELRGRGTERTAKCVFHDDSNPSLGINIEEGLYICRVPSCGARGDFVEFYRKRRSLSFREAVLELARYVGINPDMDERSAESTSSVMEANERMLQAFQRADRPENAGTPEVDRIIDPDVVNGAHRRLLMQSQELGWLDTVRGLTRATVERFKLGHDGQRFYIPITNAEGGYVNIRKYKPRAPGHEKMISYRTGYGEARLFPLQMLQEEGPIYLFEGEMDALLGAQHGLNAMTCTGGAGTWRAVWNDMFRNRQVIICYDVDEAGRRGATHVAQQLYGIVESVRVLRLPLTEPAGADFTDYIVGHGHSIVDFMELAQMAPEYTGSERADPIHQEPTEVHLSQASHARYYNVPVRMQVVVSGKTMAPYLLPRTVRLECGTHMGYGNICNKCKVQENGAPLTLEMHYDSNEVLQFCNVNEDTLKRKLKAKAGVPGRCTYAETKVIEAMNVEEVQLIPEIDRSEEEQPYVTRTAFYLGHGLKTNRSYIVTGITAPVPSDQHATHLLHDATPAQNSIDSFTLDEAVVRELSVFSVPDTGGLTSPLWAKLADLHEDMERVTGIFERRDLMLATDLTYHSVLCFQFQGQWLARGWCELLIIGDSRTGKTTVVSNMMQYYGAGEFTSGENTSYAGLVGGLHQIGTTWNVSWGKMPLNDRRLVTIDEASNLPHEQIGRMSAMRSSGVAEVTKIHTEKTSARTRAIYITNPRSPRPLSTFSQGVIAVKEMVGAPEDVARFDMVVAVSSTDVSLDVVNARRERQSTEILSPRLCHQRVMWAWSRRKEQVHFTEEAVEHLLRRATEQGREYRHATEIPLVEPNEQRIKLARLAVAAAAMFFSTDERGEVVRVRKEHVQFAFEFTEKLYSKPSLGFKEYAANAKRRYELDDPRSLIPTIIRREPGAARALMEQEQLTQRDLQEILGYDERSQLRGALATLRDTGFVRRIGTSCYVKTPAAINWLRAEMAGGHDSFRENMMAAAHEVLAAQDLAHQHGAAEDDDAEGPEW